MFLKNSKENPQIRIMDRKTCEDGRTLYKICWIQNQNKITWEPTHCIAQYYEQIRLFQSQLSKKNTSWQPLPSGYTPHNQVIKENNKQKNRVSSFSKYLEKVQNRKKNHEQANTTKNNIIQKHNLENIQKQFQSQKYQQNSKVNRRELNRNLDQIQNLTNIACNTNTQNNDVIKTQWKKPQKQISKSNLQQNGVSKQIQAIMIDSGQSNLNSEQIQFQNIIQRLGDVKNRNGIRHQYQHCSNDLTSTTKNNDMRFKIAQLISDSKASKNNMYEPLFKKIKKVGNKSSQHQKRNIKKWKQYLCNLAKKQSDALNQYQINQQISDIEKHQIKQIKEIKMVNNVWRAFCVNQKGKNIMVLRDQLRIRYPQLLLSYYQQMKKKMKMIECA